MEKKIKFSDKSKVSKIVYATVIAILCVSAIVIGIVAANSRKKTDVEEPAPDDGTQQGTQDGDAAPAPDSGDNKVEEQQPTEPAPTPKLAFVSPVTGTVIKSHSTTVPVFSNTLEEWRIHTGLDISVADGAEVAAAEAGTVTSVHYDPKFGNTVEITHNDTHKTVYSNLDPASIKVAVGDSVTSGAVIASVGDSAIWELADEPHLHFEMLVSGVSVNPLDYIEEASKSASLGIVSSDAA